MTRKCLRRSMILFLSMLMVTASILPVFAGSTYKSTVSGKSAILVNGKTKTYNGVTVNKTGNYSGEDADFYGTNAAVLAKNGGTLTLKNATVTTSGTHANGVFSYGSGTTVNVSNTKITTKKNMSGGIMTTGGAKMIAKNLTVRTYGNSSAAIRSDRGGGTVKVTGGTYTTSGVGSPAIYSTANITVNKATLKATKSEGVVIEGGNSVTLNNSTVTGNNSVLNGQSKVKTGVMIYQSMSGDASSGDSEFNMTGGTLTSKTGSVFYVTNTTTEINLKNVTINKASNGKFMIVAAGPWGSSGSNGGNVTLNASSQTIKGKITVDKYSSLTLNLKNKSTFTGSLTGAGTKNVTIAKGSTWKLTGNSTVKSLTNNGTIDLNGYTLTVNGKTYNG